MVNFVYQNTAISIHAPLTGSDARDPDALLDLVISIHAPLTGSDGLQHLVATSWDDFNPRSPYGERHS